MAQAKAPTELVWRAPPECPTQRQAQQTLSSLIGDGDTGSRVVIEIRATGAVYAAAVTFTGEAPGQRDVAGASCASVSNAALLIVALTLDPLAAVDRVMIVPENPKPDAPLHVDLGAHVSADLGTLASATAGATLEVGLALARMYLAAQASLWVPQLRLNADGRGGEMGLAEGGVRGCWDVLRSGRFAAGPCAAFSIGRYWGSGRGWNLRNLEEGESPWAAARVGIRMRQQSEPLLLDVALEVGRAVVSPEFTLDGEPFFSPSWFGRLSLGIGWRF